MKESFLISLVVIIIYIYMFFSKKKIVFVKSNFDNQRYLVRDDNGKNQAADLLAKLISNIYKLINHVSTLKNSNREFSDYCIQLENNVNKSKTRIYENSGYDGFTSYTVNKGEEIVFCLRSKNTKKFHPINLIMYVAIHELAHCACPEEGHTPLFQKIFRFLTEEAIKIKVYNKEDYNSHPVEYCGMTLSTSII
jgi:predicted metal-dependent hydrolase